MSLLLTLSLVLLATIWGSYYVITQQALTYIPVFAMGFFLRLITAVILTIIMTCQRGLKSLKHSRKMTLRLLMVGVLGFLLDATAFLGLRLSPAGIGTVLLKCDVLFVNVISMIFYHYRFSAKEWIYTFVMLSGVVLLLGIDWQTADIWGSGNIFFILSALFVSINAFLIKEIQNDASEPVSDQVIAYYNNFMTMVLFGGVMLLTGQYTQLNQVTTDRALPWLMVLGAAAQTGVYILYYYDLRRLPVWIVKVFLLLIPLVSSVLALTLFDERLSSWQLIGMGVLLAGAFGILLEQKNRKKVCEISGNK